MAGARPFPQSTTQLKATISRLMRETQDLAQALTKRETEQKNLTDQITLLKESLDMAGRESSLLTETKQHFAEKVKELVTINLSLTSDLNHLETEKRELTTQVATLTHEQTLIKKEMEEALQEKQRALKEASELKLENDTRLTDKIITLKHQLAEKDRLLQQERETTQRRLDNQRQSTAEMLHAIQSLKAISKKPSRKTSVATQTGEDTEGDNLIVAPLLSPTGKSSDSWMNVEAPKTSEDKSREFAKEIAGTVDPKVTPTPSTDEGLFSFVKNATYNLFSSSSSSSTSTSSPTPAVATPLTTAQQSPRSSRA